MKAKIIIILLAGSSVVFACRNEKKQVLKKDTIKVIKPEVNKQNKLKTPESAFATMAYEIKDFIPQYYKIDMETEGDLNRDGLEDKVVVLINTRDTTAQRATLILLKINDAYSLDKKSFSALEPKYREDGFQIYDTEDVSIDSTGTLTFQMYSPGPAGNLSSSYKYFKNELVLINVNTYNMGAGGHTELDLDLLNGIYEETNTNTMKEDMPSETITKKYKLPKVTFEKSSPKDIVIEAFNANKWDVKDK